MNKFWLGLICLALTGCDQLPIGYASLKEIQAAPEKFENQEIRIHGEVVNTEVVPGSPLKIYYLGHKDGEFIVFTERDLPAKKTSVGVRGVITKLSAPTTQEIMWYLNEKARWEMMW